MSAIDFRAADRDRSELIVWADHWGGGRERERERERDIKTLRCPSG